MGNPNILWWRWDRFATSVENAQICSMPLKIPTAVADFTPPVIGARQVIMGGKGGDLIEIHEMHMIEVGSGFPNTFPPFMDVDFEINDVTYYRKLWQSRVTPPFVVDFNVVASNVPPFTPAPLLLSGGETLRISMTDGNRPSNSDRYNIEVDLWGIKL